MSKANNNTISIKNLNKFKENTKHVIRILSGSTMPRTKPCVYCTDALKQLFNVMNI